MAADRTGWRYVARTAIAGGALLLVTGLGVAIVDPGSVDVPAFDTPDTGLAPRSGATLSTPPVGPSRRALDVLATLPVAAPAAGPRYDRDAQFGSGWRDDDGDGCDTRQEILARDAISGRLDVDGCAADVVVADPYTGATLPQNEVQIDHVVALGDAWDTGAQQLTRAERVALANDPLNLLAVSGRENQSKSDDDASQWLPPLLSEQCPYVARQAAVKSRYRLWLEPAEQAAAERVLRTCPAQEIPR